MTVSAENIWQVPVYLPYLQPDLTDTVVKKAEKKLGFQLPKEFINILKKQNGGYIRFSLPDTPHRMISGIGPHFPSLLDFDWKECQEYVNYPLKGLIPFDGDGHWYLCLDYRKNMEFPSVTYIDIECDEQLHIAQSFQGYLDKLVLDIDDDYVIYGMEIGDVLNILSNILNKKIEKPGSWANGYSVYRIPLGSENRPEWLWLSPNLVPRGFVRESDSRYNQLKDLFPGNALRFPELPAESLILSVTEGVSKRILEALTSSNLQFKHIREFIN